jgi:hypothetical protein
MSRGRLLLISYFQAPSTRGGIDGDVVLAWLDDPAEAPGDTLVVDDLDQPTTLIHSELAPLFAEVRARLELAGPRWLPALRHPVVRINDTGAWMTFFRDGGGVGSLRRPDRR